MLTYVKQNMVAFVALFIAILSLGSTSAYAINSIRSSDIVDGQVMNADIAANAVGNGKIQDGSVLGADIKDDALSGADIKESTLGQVPNARTLNGVPLDGLQHRTITNYQTTDSCIQPFSWVQCAPVTVVIPAGHNYVVTVWSTMTTENGATSQTISFCPAFNVPTCFNSAPDVVTLPANEFTNAASSATAHFGPGTYTFSTAAFYSSPVVESGNAKTETTVEYHDYQAEGLKP